VKARAIESIFLTRASRPEVPSTRVLVLGGDTTGILVAERLAGEGFPVLLLGPSDGASVPDTVAVLSGMELEEIRGFVGGFDIVLGNSTGRSVERVGFVVAAQPEDVVPKFQDYGLAKSESVRSLSDVEAHVRSSAMTVPRHGEWSHVAFLLGLERGSDPTVLSRTLAVIETLGQMEKVQTYVFTRQLKVAASGLERQYRECRENGTIFFKFDDAGPIFEGDPEAPVMVFNEPLLGREMELVPDLIVVDEHLGPPTSLNPLLEAMPISFMADPYLQPESTRFSGVETPKAGILALGPSRGVFDPNLIKSDVESVLAVLKQAGDEPRDKNLPGPPEIDPAKCTMCLTCVRLCPHGAMTFAKTAQADPDTCVRCGICAVECPMKAITLAPGPGQTAIDSRVQQGLTRTTSSKKILGFLCSRSAGQALHASKMEILENLVPIVVPCAGSLDVSHILHAFQEGADAVIVAGCFKGNCASGYGTVLAEERSRMAREILDTVGIEPSLLQFVSTAGNTPGVLARAVSELETRFSALT
jgi:quinone-modifying oxidoreductase subunit QmoB